MIIMSAGTILESLHGADTARIVVYEAGWFNLVLLLLGMNVAAAALDRLPWQKKHAGFVITHAGIITLLIGSFLTQKLMIDGQMAIAEHETENKISLPEPVLYIYSQTRDKSWAIDLEKKPFPWQGTQEIHAGAGLPLHFKLLSYYPKAKVSENITSAETGPAALKVHLKNSFMEQTLWLMENDPERGEIQMGPAKLKFTDQPLEETKIETPKTPYLELQFEKSTLPILLEENLKVPAEFAVKGTDYKIRLLRLFKNATVKGRELIEQENAAETNPAAELILTGPGFEEKHTVFSKFPDFPTVHGMKPSAAGVRIFYRMPGGGSRGRDHEIRFFRKDGQLFYQLKTGLEVKTGAVVTDEKVVTGWMDLHFEVKEFYPSAGVNRVFSPQPNNTENPQAVSAIRLEAETGGERKVLWLRQGFQEEVVLGNESYIFAYGEKRIPAGFKLTLRDFRIEHYPGTERPASFESDVTLKDDMRGVVKDVKISMNEPLDYRGYKIYQSGYNLAEGQPEISVFAVGKDPGVPLKYLGIIVMVIGIMTMFYTRRFSFRAGRY